MSLVSSLTKRNKVHWPVCGIFESMVQHKVLVFQDSPYIDIWTPFSFCCECKPHISSGDSVS